MVKTVLLTACLLAGTWQAALSQESSALGPKSTASAVKYSAYGTALPIAVGGALVLSTWGSDSDDDQNQLIIGLHIGALGAVVGPGLGHAYAGRWGHLAKGTAFRTVGALLLTAGIIEGATADMKLWGDSDEEDSEGRGSYWPPIILGGAIYLWSTIHDFRTLDDAVARYNQEHTGVTFGVSPAYFADQDALGIVVSVDF